MSDSARRRIVPVSLGIAMLAVVVAASLVPNVGAVPAASNCSYNQCPSNSGVAPWELASIGAIVVLGLLVGLFVVMRRRRRPPAEGMAGGPAPPNGPPTGAVQQNAPGGSDPDLMGASAYVETPDDVGTAPPDLTSPPTAGPATGGAAADAEPDIDSLMAELDKISGEILKRTPKKGAPTTDEDADDEPGN